MMMRWMRWHWMTQNSKFEPWRSDAENATSRSRRLPTIFNFYEWARKKHFVWNLNARAGFELAIFDFPSRQLHPLHQGPRPSATPYHSLYYITLLGHAASNTPYHISYHLELIYHRIRTGLCNLYTFSLTWICVSLPRPTTSSGWKLLIIRLIWEQTFANLDV